MRPLALLSLIILLASGCYYDNEEELYGPSCDASVFSYSAKIQPILQTNCYASNCHGPNGENGELITYADVRAVVDDGTFRQAVIVEKRMPDGGSLTACELVLIEKWLDADTQRLNNSMKRKILTAVLVIAVAGGFIGYRLFNEKTPTASEKSADVSVDAVALYTAFAEDEVAAGKLYNDKVVQVKGVVQSMEAQPNGPMNVMLETGDDLGTVVCEFAVGNSPTWQNGQTVTLKGFCAGFNLDVLLQRCAVVE